MTALAVDMVEEYDGDIQYVEAVLDGHAAQPDASFVVLTPMGSGVHQGYAGRLRDAGIPVLEGMTSGLRAMRHLLDAARPRRRSPQTRRPRSARSRRSTARSASRTPSAC